MVLEGEGPLFRRAAFVSSAEGPYAIYLMTPNGSRSLLLGDAQYELAPAWSRDGGRIAFTRAEREIVIVDAHAGGAQVLALQATYEGDPVPRDARDPSWSSDGSRIAFVGADQGGVARFYVCGADGTGLRAVSPNGVNCGPPAWSPTEEVIAVAASGAESGRPTLHCFAADGSGAAWVSDTPMEGRPDWSPDGKRLVVSNALGQIVLTDGDGTTLSPVGDGPLGYRPTWTPGGTHLAYGFGSGICDWIYVVRLDGTDARPLIDFARDVAFAPADPLMNRLGSSIATGAVGSRRRMPKRPPDPAPPADVDITEAVVIALGQQTGYVPLQIQRATDRDGALSALESARRDIHALEIPDHEYERAQASPALPLTNGPAFAVHAPWSDRREFARVATDLLRRSLIRYGVSGSLVPLRRPQSLGDYAPELGPGVSLRLFPAAPSEQERRARRWRVPMPERWLDVACDWTASQSEAGGGQVRVGVTAFWAWLPTEEQRTVARHCHGVGWESVAEASFTFISGADEGPLRGSHASLMGSHWLQLSGGPAASRDDLLRLYTELTGIAHALSPETAYSCVAFEDNVRFAPVVLSRPGEAPADLVERLCDEIILDAFPYQVLGPGHLARLSASGEISSACRTTPALRGRIAVAVSDPQEWLTEPALQQDLGRDALAPCILTSDDARSLLQSRESTR